MAKMEDIIKRVLRKFAEQAEAEIRMEASQDAEALHNALVGAIAEQNADAPTVLYVLKLLEFETLRSEYEKIFAPSKE